MEQVKRSGLIVGICWDGGNSERGVCDSKGLEVAW